jgi:hypothetical protein
MSSVFLALVQSGIDLIIECGALHLRAPELKRFGCRGMISSMRLRHSQAP